MSSASSARLIPPASVPDVHFSEEPCPAAGGAPSTDDPERVTCPGCRGQLVEVEITTAPPISIEAAFSRDQRRSRRKRAVRARSISVKRLAKRDLLIGQALYPERTEHLRPETRGDCVDGPRPCPFVSCQHHLYLDVNRRNGTVKLNFPDLEVWDMNETCALDVADRGGTTLEDVGAIMNLTRERIRQVEVKALAKLEALKDVAALRDYVDEGPVGKRRLPVLGDAGKRRHLHLVPDAPEGEEELEDPEDLDEDLEDGDPDDGDELLVDGDVSEEPLG